MNYKTGTVTNTQAAVESKVFLTSLQAKLHSGGVKVESCQINLDNLQNHNSFFLIFIYMKYKQMPHIKDLRQTGISRFKRWFDKMVMTRKIGNDYLFSTKKISFPTLKSRHHY